MEKIIPEGVYDSEKWVSDYVEVRRNFQYPPNEYGHLEITTRRGDPCKHFILFHSFLPVVFSIKKLSFLIFFHLFVLGKHNEA